MKKLEEKHLRILLASLAVVIVLAVFIALVAVPSMKKAAIKNAKEDLFEQMYSFPEGGIITTENGFNNNEKNSLLYVKAALQNGADCVEVDVCFDESGVPYVAESPEEIDENTMPLEYLISFFQEESMKENQRRHYLNMRLTDAANLEEIDKIVKNYEMLDYCFFTGVNLNQSKFVRTSCDIGFYLDYEIDKNKTKNQEYINTIINDLSLSGAIGINCKIDGFTPELSAILKENWYKISFTGLEGELDIITAVSMSPNQIITSDPDYTRSILTEWNANAPSSDIIFS